MLTVCGFYRNSRIHGPARGSDDKLPVIPEAFAYSHFKTSIDIYRTVPPISLQPWSSWPRHPFASQLHLRPTDDPSDVPTRMGDGPQTRTKSTYTIPTPKRSGWPSGWDQQRYSQPTIRPLIKGQRELKNSHGRFINLFNTVA
jgi:hypothetical protein